MLLALQASVDGGCALLACAHGQDDGGSTGDGIAAGEDALARGHLVLIDDEAALLVGLQAGGGGADQRVRGRAEGHDDHVDVEDKFAALHGDRAARTGAKTVRISARIELVPSRPLFWWR